MYRSNQCLATLKRDEEAGEAVSMANTATWAAIEQASNKRRTSVVAHANISPPSIEDQHEQAMQTMACLRMLSQSPSSHIKFHARHLSMGWT
jgi:hypothetical protein